MNLETFVKSLQRAVHLGVFLLWMYALYGLSNYQIDPWLNVFITLSIALIQVIISLLIRGKSNFVRTLFTFFLCLQILLTNELLNRPDWLESNWRILPLLLLPTIFTVLLHYRLKITPEKPWIQLALMSIIFLLPLILFLFIPSFLTKSLLYLSFLGGIVMLFWGGKKSKNGE
jgi:hypothetical protein